MDIDFGTNKILTDKMKADKITKRESATFTADRLTFLKSLTSKFVEKSSFKVCCCSKC